MEGRRRWAWLLQTLAAWGVGAAFCVWQPLVQLEEPLVDLRFRLRGAVQPSDRVVLVAIDEEAQAVHGAWPWPQARLASLFEAIHADGPLGIVCTSALPASLKKRFAYVVSARAFRYRPNDPLEPIEALGAPEIRTGLAWIPLQPVVRRVPVAIELAREGWAPSLLGAALADARGAFDPGGLVWADPVHGGAMVRYGPTFSLPVEVHGRVASLRVAYAGGAGTYPTVSAKRVLSGELGGEGVFAGRMVVVGPTDARTGNGRLTPCSSWTPMSETEIIGAALETAFARRFLTWLPVRDTLVGLLVALFVLGVVLRRLRAWGGVIALVLFLSSVTLWAMAAFRSGTIVALLPWWSGGFAAWLSVLLARADLADRETEALCKEIERLDPRFGAVHVRRRTARWRAALEMAAQFLDVDSLVLMRIEPESGRLRVVACYRCQEEEIAERRRDPSRTPYREAADPLSQVLCERFMREERKVVSLLVPVIAVTRTLGFFVVNRARGTEERFAAQRELIRFLAAQMATILHREGLAVEPRRRLHRAMRLVTHDRSVLEHALLSATLQRALEDKNLLLQTLETVEDAVALADLFGHVLYYNASLARIAEQAGVRIEGQALLVVLGALTGLERSDLIERLSEVVLGGRFEREVELRGRSARRYRFSLSVVYGEGKAVLGLVALFSDITSLKQLDQMKTNLLSMVSYRVLNMLASIQGYAELLSDSQGLGEDDKEFARAIHAQAVALSGVFDSVHAMAGMELSSDGLRLMPIDLVEIIHEVFERARELEPDREIELELEAPERFDIVAADRAMISEALLDVTRFAMENAQPGTRLRVAIAEEERYLRLDVINRGYGLPAELAAALFGTDDGFEAQPAPLARVKEVFELHGGTTKAQATVGEGLKFHLWLPLFMKGVGSA